MTPFDQIYWNSGLGFAEPGEYVFSSAKVGQLGQTANRNPDSTFSLPGGTTNQNEADSWLAQKVNNETVFNLFHGIHANDPLTISPDKPYKGARLVLKREAYWYFTSCADLYSRQITTTQALAYQYIKVKKNGVVQRPAEHGIFPNPTDETIARFASVSGPDPKYHKWTIGNFYIDGTNGTNTLTWYYGAEVNPDGGPFTLWYPAQYIRKGFFLHLDGVLYEVASVDDATNSVTTVETITSTITKEPLVVWEEKGSPGIDDVVHVVDTQDTTAGIINASSNASFNDDSGDGMEDSTWGFVPHKYDPSDLASPYYEDTTSPVFEAWSGPNFSSEYYDDWGAGGTASDGVPDTQMLSYAQSALAVGGSTVKWKLPSIQSQAAWPQYLNDFYTLTNNDAGIRSGGPFGNNAAPDYSEVLYQGIPDVNRWDQVYQVSRINRKDQNDVQAQSYRNMNQYPYLGGAAGFYNANDPGGALGQTPTDWETPYYMTIWETDEVLTPGDTYEVTLQGPITNLLHSVGCGQQWRIKRNEFKIALIAK